MSRVGVIGGGLGGLAAACTLAARATRGAVRAKAWLGGKAAELLEAGLRFDMGPTILTLPRVLGRIFSEAGRRMEDVLDLLRLDPQWRCFFEDGLALDLRADVGEDGRRPASFGRAQGYGDISALGPECTPFGPIFFWRSVWDVFDPIDFRMISGVHLADVLRLGMGSTVAQEIRKPVPEARVAQMLDHFVQYVGSSPDASPAVLCGIAHMQTREGVWYPRGGTRAVPEALWPWRPSWMWNFASAAACGV